MKKPRKDTKNRRNHPAKGGKPLYLTSSQGWLMAVAIKKIADRKKGL